MTLQFRNFRIHVPNDPERRDPSLEFPSQLRQLIQSMTKLNTLRFNLCGESLDVFEEAFEGASFPSITEVELCCTDPHFVVRNCPSIRKLEAPFSNNCHPQVRRCAYGIVSAVFGKDLRSLCLCGSWTTDLTEGDSLLYLAR